MMTNGADAKDYARTAITQVLTLSSGILGISITFAKNINSSHIPGLLEAAWLLYIGAIFFSILCLLALTGIVMAQKTLNSWGLRLFWIAQLLTFFVGTVLFVIAGIQSI
jgi:hypothetical protein